MQAKHICLSPVDRFGANVSELISGMTTGDVLVIVRDTAAITVWIMGQAVNRGHYYRLPIKVRSCTGSFAADDLIDVDYLKDEPETEPEPEQLPAPVTQPVALTAQESEPATDQQVAALRAKLEESEQGRTAAETMLQALLDDDEPAYVVKETTQ